MSLTSWRNNQCVFVALLLLLLAVLNVPQAMVLCVGDDGHVAIEPAGHDHCVDGLHSCGRASAQPDEHSHVAHEHCRPCVDIPIVVAAGRNRIVSQRSDVPLICLSHVQPTMLTGSPLDAGQTVASSSRLLPLSCGDPLQGIILQV